MKVNLTAINNDLAAAASIMPQLTAAYAAYRVIWTAINPGKTEDDYLQHLLDVSKQNVSAADAILLADGYVQDPTTGNWSKSAAASGATPTASS